MGYSGTKVNRELLEGIGVSFENCEYIYIPEQYIETLDVKDIKRVMYLEGTNGEIRETVTSNYVNLTVHKYGDTEDILKKGMLFSDEYDPYDGYTRLIRSNDITSIVYKYKDGTKESMGVDYSIEDNYYDPNRYHVVTPVITKEVPRGVNITIASPDTLAKFRR